MNSRDHFGVRAAWIFPLLVSFVHGCAGYVPGRQAYWDAQVREMCAKDGGVEIFDKLRLKERDLQFISRRDGKFLVPSKQSAVPNAPVYSEMRITYLRKEPGPQVWRAESIITRTSDQAVIARWVVYTRSGGDLPSPAHESHFTCPDLKTIASDIQRLFVVDGEEK